MNMDMPSLAIVLQLLFSSCSGISGYGYEKPLSRITGIPCCALNVTTNDADMDEQLDFDLDEPIDCGRYPLRPPTESGRILHGKDTYVSQFPWYVAFLHWDKDGYYSFCGGVIVDKNHVLTAAHCLDDDMDTEEGVILAFGVHGLTTSSLWHIQMKVKLNKWTNVFFPKGKRKYGYNNLYDLAIIKVPGGIYSFPDEYTGGLINSICWKSVMHYDYSSCRNVTVAGFGLDYGADLYPRNPDILQTTRLRICERQHCVHMDHKLSDDTLRQDEFCTANRNPPRTRICPGDSGSPVMASINSPHPKFEHKRALLVGIAKRSPPPCDETVSTDFKLQPGTVTNTRFHLRWIMGVISNLPEMVKAPSTWWTFCC